MTPSEQNRGTMKRYDMVVNYRCGECIDELEPADDGEWMRFEDHEAALAQARAQGQQEERFACIEDALNTTDGNADSQRIVRAIRARAVGILSDEQCAGLEDAAKKWARVRGGEGRKEGARR